MLYCLGEHCHTLAVRISPDFVLLITLITLITRSEERRKKKKEKEREEEGEKELRLAVAVRRLRTPAEGALAGEAALAASEKSSDFSYPYTRPLTPYMTYVLHNARVSRPNCP